MAIEQAGKYLARAIPDTVNFGESSNNNEQVAVSFDFLDGNGDATGDRMTWFGSLAEGKAQDITIEALRNAGARLDGSIFDLEGLGSVEVELVVDWNEYNGKRNLRINWVNAAGGQRFTFKTQLDDKGKKALDAKLKAKLGAKLGGAPKPAPAILSEDIPFR